MINWRSIKIEGMPRGLNKTYLVTDGKEVSTTDIRINTNYKTGKLEFNGWSGDSNTYEDNQCCSGTPMFDLIPTHWCPTDEIKLPQTPIKD